MTNGIRASKSHVARKWLEQKGLSIDLTHACFNSGQIHHRKAQSFIEALKSVDFLKEYGINSRKENETPTYNSFGKGAITFPLRNEKNEVVNFYAIRIHLETQKTEYLNEEGIYPCYPAAQTTKLYITKNILDAATLLETRVLENRDAVMALNDGELKEQHLNAIDGLQNLKEIIVIN